MCNFISLMSFAIFILNISTVYAAESEGLVRIYCSYLPKDKVSQNLEPQQQIQALVSEKLVNASGESLKMMAIFRPNDFALEEADYLSVYGKCQEFVKNKGILFNLKASNANLFESLSFSYPVTLKANATVEMGPDGLPRQVLPLDDPRILEKLNLTPEQHLMISNEASEWINQHPGLIQKLVTTVVQPLSTAASALMSVPYVKETLTVASILAAAWFGPAYVAGAVDLLYPIVYSVLFGGVPSKLGFSYWLVYYPGKLRAVTWAFNNSSLIIGLAGTASALVGNVIPNFGIFGRK